MNLQMISADEALRMKGRPGVLYVLNQPPHTAYTWDGQTLVALSGSGGSAAHAASHATGGSDPITPASIGAQRDGYIGPVAVTGTPTAGQVPIASSETAAAWGAATAAPAGSDTQVQFNDAGAAAGAAGLTWDKTAGTLTHASGTRTTSGPIQALSQTWNNAAVTFTGWQLDITDTASSAASLALRVRFGGTTKFSVAKNGDLSVAPGVDGGTISFVNSSYGLRWHGGGSFRIGLGDFNSAYQSISTGGYHLGASQRFAWSNQATIGNPSIYDTALYRISAGIVGQHNGTAAQGYEWYGTRTDASNYRRLSAGMSNTGTAYLRAEGAGTGASGNVLHISGLPTSNPGPGILWNDAGTVKVGT